MIERLDRQQIADAVRYEGRVSRRLFLAFGASLAAIPSLADRCSAADRQPKFSRDPFSLGVASGDPDANSVVLWTKLAPDSTAPDGGMPPESVKVAWEVAEDEGFARVVAHGTTIAAVQLGHAVHVEARGLRPDRWYWYRFRAGDATSPVGRTRTLPAVDADQMPARLRFAFASCQHYEHGLYTAYQQMARDELDLVFHLGDYIYEYPHKELSIVVRKHSGPTKTKLLTLADYRGRYMQYRSDPLLHGMHAQCPWFVAWDDHEFDNNCAGAISELNVNPDKAVDPIDFLVQRAAAYQAYYEIMPLRRRSLPRGSDMLLYRRASFGRLAELFVLDTRQYRTDQPNGDGHKPLNDEALKKTNTLLGHQQRGWLTAGLLESPGTWNVLAQQVMMALVDRKPGDETGYSMDQWPGAAYERMELVRFLADRQIPNPVVLTGDIHSNWVNDLRVDDRRADTPVVATEFVGTSLSSGGNGPTKIDGLNQLLAENPCIRFHNRERGYVRCEVTPKTWTSDYVVVEDVTKPDGKVLTRASFVVEAGTAGAKPA